MVQSAREFYKWFVEVLKDVGFTVNKLDPCLLSKWYDDENVLTGVYVANCLVIGKEGPISKLIIDLKAGSFNLTVTKQLSDYLSCHVSKNESRNEIFVL